MYTYQQVKDLYHVELALGTIEPDLGTFIRDRFENVYDDELNWLGFTDKEDIFTNSFR